MTEQPIIVRVLLDTHRLLSVSDLQPLVASTPELLAQLAAKGPVLDARRVDYAETSLLLTSVFGPPVSIRITCERSTRPEDTVRLCRARSNELADLSSRLLHSERSPALDHADDERASHAVFLLMGIFDVVLGAIRFDHMLKQIRNVTFSASRFGQDRLPNEEFGFPRTRAPSMPTSRKLH